MNLNENKNSESISRAYSSEPWWYDLRGLLILTFSYRTTLTSQLVFFASNIKKEHLEVAIGSGTLLGLILHWRRWKNLPTGNINGFDYAERMLAGARQRFHDDKNINIICANASNLPWKEGSFDSANAANCLHCFPELEKSISEIQRVLKNRGTLAGNFLLEPQGHSFLDPISKKINLWGKKKGILFRPYQIQEIRSLLQKTGFKITKESIKGNSYDFVAQKN